MPQVLNFSTGSKHFGHGSKTKTHYVHTSNLWSNFEKRKIYIKVSKIQKKCKHEIWAQFPKSKWLVILQV